MKPRLRRRARSLATASVVWIAAVPSAAASQEATLPAACDDVRGFHRLDFWAGTWDVQVNGRTVGRNRIEKILDGCAVLEHWRGQAGGEGKSLFYYIPANDTWKQVWVTAGATGRGGVKEKELVETTADGGLRFLGEIPLADGTSYLDRTTLTPLPGGRVRQVIDRSTDGGETWHTGFDAVYVPVATEASGSEAKPP